MILVKEEKPEVNLINERIQNYITERTIETSPLLDEMHDHALKTEVSIVGPLAGHFLFIVSLISRSKKIFELGSGFGYSAYWFAQALGPGGRVTCTDLSEENMSKALYFFKKAGIEDLIDFHTGNALEILSRTDDKFDIVFNDVDKEFYPDVIDLAYDKLVPGGLFITDNVIWQGKVLQDDDSPSTRGVKAFNDLICKDDRFVTDFVTIRDGISISYKR